MEIIERFWNELVEETTFITSHLQASWNLLSFNEQLYALMMLSATCLLLGLRNPSRATAFKTLGEREELSTFKTFMFAAAVLMMFTFAVDVAVDTVS
ncbi:MAG: hypothetical protein AAF292_05860 [Pseudomonadota bacterium]